MSFIKKNFICKEKSGTDTKLKLATKNKAHSQIYYGNLVLASYCYSADNVWNTDFFQNTGFKESRTMAL